MERDREYDDWSGASVGLVLVLAAIFVGAAVLGLATGIL
jgi:hypothetical protein